MLISWYILVVMLMNAKTWETWPVQCWSGDPFMWECSAWPVQCWSGDPFLWECSAEQAQSGKMQCLVSYDTVSLLLLMHHTLIVLQNFVLSPVPPKSSCRPSTFCTADIWGHRWCSKMDPATAIKWPCCFGFLFWTNDGGEDFIQEFGALHPLGGNLVQIQVLQTGRLYASE